MNDLMKEKHQRLCNNFVFNQVCQAAAKVLTNLAQKFPLKRKCNQEPLYCLHNFQILYSTL